MTLMTRPAGAWPAPGQRPRPRFPSSALVARPLTESAALSSPLTRDTWRGEGGGFSYKGCVEKAKGFTENAGRRAEKPKQNFAVKEKALPYKTEKE